MPRSLLRKNARTLAWHQSAWHQSAWHQSAWCRWLAFAVLAGAMHSLGCSKSDRPSLGRVEGFVTLDGLPLAEAAVLFTPEGPGRTSIGRTDSTGRYRLTYLRDIEGADVGQHSVRIMTASESNRKERLPKRYHAETELSATVQPGGNQYDFALQSK